MNPVGRLALGVLVAQAIACGGAGPATTQASYADSLVAEDAGPIFARAYRAHAPTTEDRRIAILALLGLVETAAGGEVHPLLLNPNLLEALQAGQFALRSSSALQTQEVLPSPFPSSSAPRAATSPTATACQESCVPDAGVIFRAAARLASRLTPARSITTVGALARLALNATSRKDVGTATAAQLSSMVADSMTDQEQIEALDQFGRIIIPVASLLQFGTDVGLITAGSSVLPAVVTSAASIILAFGVGYGLGTAINDAIWSHLDCAAWKEVNCAYCGGAGLLQGNVCCADGTQGVSCCGGSALTTGLLCCPDLSQAPTCCEPNCSGKACGDDGCGGTCAPGCLSSQSCNSGICECVPDCAGKACGDDDGCGAACHAVPGATCCAAGDMYRTCAAGSTCSPCGCLGAGETCCAAGNICYSDMVCLVCSGNPTCGAQGGKCCGFTAVEGSATCCAAGDMHAACAAGSTCSPCGCLRADETCCPNGSICTIGMVCTACGCQVPGQQCG